MSFCKEISAHVLLCLSLLVIFAMESFGVEAVWIGGPAGNWTEETNWSTGLVPSGPTTNVIIDGNPAESSALVLESVIAIGNLTLDHGDLLGLENSGQLAAGFVTVDGDLVMNPATRLNVSELLWIQLGGRLSMSDSPAQTGAFVGGTSGSLALWNQGLIEGAGSVGANLPLANEGIIEGNLPGEILSLLLTSTLNSNQGSLYAADGGSLLVRATSSTAILQNSSGGVDGLIQARHGGSTVIVQNVNVVGGEISTSADEDGNHGLVNLQQVTLNGVNLEGNIAGNRITFQNTVENNTTITNNGGSAFVSVTSPTILSGNGKLQMVRGSIDGTGSSTSDLYFVNDVDHTVAGAGSIFADRFKFINRGLVEAQTESGDSELTLQLGSARTTVNTGVLRAINQSTLNITAIGSPLVFENYEGDDQGVIEADVDSTVRLGSYTLRGGVLRTVAPAAEGASVAGKIVNSLGTPTTLRDVRLEGTVGDQSSVWHITGEIENTGVFRAYEIQIDSEATLTGGGTLQLGQGTSNALIRGGTNPTLLVNEDNTITGTGIIDLFGFVFKNRGTIMAEQVSPSLTIQGSFSEFPNNASFHNSGMLKATNGATLSIQAQVLNREGAVAGTIHADDNSTVRIGAITGGVLSTTGTGEIWAGESFPGALRDVHNQGFLRVRGSTDIVGTLRNDGTMLNDANDIVRFSGPAVHLTGTGIYGPQFIPFNFAVGQSTATMLVHGPDHTIHGRGALNVVNGGFINQGTLIAEGSGPFEIILGFGTIMRQQGNLIAHAASEMRIRTYNQQFINEGTIDANGYVSILEEAQALDVINSANSTVLGLGSIVLAAPGVFPMTFWNQAGATVSGGLNFNFSGTNEAQPKLFRNSGLISPDGHHESQAHIFMNADFQQDATGVLDFDLGGPSSSGWFDALDTQGDIVLGGTLEISLAEGFDPTVGESYAILNSQAGTIAGTFDSFLAPALAGRWWSLGYQSTQVVLSIQAITADFDGNGLVDGDDLDDWQLAYQDGTNAADADGDGDSDGSDFLAWQRQYGSGVPVGELSVAVPEPSSVLLLLFGAGFSQPRRHRRC